MDASVHATLLAIAISEGIDHLAYIRSLRAAPPPSSAAELEEWSDIFARAQSAFAELQTQIQAGKAQASMRLTSDLVRCFADVRAHLSEIVPGAQLPATLFDLVEVAWSEVAKSA
jgi:hypothetical protein